MDTLELDIAGLISAKANGYAGLGVLLAIVALVLAYHLVASRKGS